ncbi:gp436 family protein [Rahnella contaminans]|uniref:gp436 family protein n=1 Tax=Rahnella contaminans TaxID=2703882 RepID=UPI003C2C59E2
MSYANTEDMRQRYSDFELIQLTNKNDPMPEAINPVVLNVALNSASSVIDGYLAVRYSLPLSTVPESLTGCACVLARYSLESGQATDQATAQYKATIKFLEGVSAGTVQLGPGTDGTNADNNDGALIESAGSVFARNKSKGFI